MQVVVAGPGPSYVDPVRAALSQLMVGGPAVAVLPDGPASWQQTVRAALVPDRPLDGGLVLPTSGSTRPPVGVVLGADALRWSATSVVDRLGGPGAWLLALPLTHVAGLMVLARALVSDAPVVSLDRRFSAEAFSAAAFVLPAGRRYTALVPTQLRRLLGTPAQALLADFDGVLVGGAAMGQTLRDRAEQAGIRVLESYGMTETCGGCVYDGRPLPRVDVRLTPAGEIELAGPMLASAYRLPEDDLPFGDWFTTHDLGGWHGDRLRIVGRTDDVVQSGGVSVALDRVDALLAEHPGLADAAAVAVPDRDWGSRVVAVAVPVPGQVTPTLDEVRAFVAERAEPGYVPQGLHLVDSLPRPAPGKVDRRALARLVEEA